MDHETIYEKQIQHKYETNIMSINKKVQQILEAKQLLVKYNYKIIDLENQIIDKHNIKDKAKRHSFNYNRTPKRLYEKTYKSIL